MDIVVRNFFRLLRAGAFHRQEQVEPMSAWKWRQVWRLSMLHGVEADTWEGVCQLQEQFFMRLTDNLRTEWQHSVVGEASKLCNVVGEASKLCNVVGEASKLCSNVSVDNASKLCKIDDEKFNPLTSRQQKRLARIAEETNPRSATYRALVLSVELANHLLKSGCWVQHLLTLGRLLESEGHFIDAAQLDDWASDLGRGRILQLEGLLLVQLLGLDADNVTFYTSSGNDKKDRRMVEDVVKAIWTTRPNLRFIKYFPQESLTSYTASLVQAIVNVEE